VIIKELPQIKRISAARGLQGITMTRLIGDHAFDVMFENDGTVVVSLNSAMGGRASDYQRLAAQLRTTTRNTTIRDNGGCVGKGRGG
jgi:hypothetical protein